MTVVTYSSFCAIAVNILRSFLWGSLPLLSPVMNVVCPSLFSPLLPFTFRPTEFYFPSDDDDDADDDDGNDGAMGANFGSVGGLGRLERNKGDTKETLLFAKNLAGRTRSQDAASETRAEMPYVVPTVSSTCTETG